MNRTRRRFIQGVGTASVVGLAGCLKNNDVGSTTTTTSDGTETTTEGIPSPVALAPLPSDPSAHTFATMGYNDAPLNVTLFGSWKCPHCASFDTGFFETLVEDYVELGDIQVTYKNVAYKLGGSPFLGSDAPRAGQAGLAVWNRSPEKYWEYHSHLMHNQPSGTWATVERLIGFMEDVGISNIDNIKSDIENEAYSEELNQISEDAGQYDDFKGVPTLVINDELVSPFDKTKVRNKIEDNL